MPTQSIDDLNGIDITENGEHWIINPLVLIYNAGIAVYMGASDIRLTNSGFIFGTSWGAYFVASDSVIVNQPDGVIKGVNSAIFTGSSGTGNRIENKGALIGTAGPAVDLYLQADNVDLNNSGTGLIRGSTVGVAVLGDGLTLKNGGTILGQSDAGLLLRAIMAEVVNKKGGTIQGAVDAIRSADSGQIDLENKGKVVGEVDLNAVGQADAIVNKGKMFGPVNLGPGDDRFVFAGGKQGIVSGEAGADRFDFKAKFVPQKHAPTIGDFTPGIDTIGLSKALFGDIGPKGQPLKAKHFQVGNNANDGNDRIIYQPGTGRLFRDEDGDGGAGKKLFAHLDPGLAMSAGDFTVIA